MNRDLVFLYFIIQIPNWTLTKLKNIYIMMPEAIEFYSDGGSIVELGEKKGKGNYGSSLSPIARFIAILYGE